MIKVLNSGFHTTIQDRGRWGFASLGVPVSGVMDAYSADLANRILNNSLDCAVLEITLGGCKLQFLSKTVICISGGNFSPKINKKPILLNSKIIVQENDILSFGKVNFGIRSYLAVKNGFQSDRKLGSRSAFKNITNTFLLRSGDILPISKLKITTETSNMLIKINKSHYESTDIECSKGPEFYLLSDQQQKKIVENQFSIYPNPNKGSFTIEFKELANSFSVEVYDVTGKTIYENNYEQSSNLIQVVDLDNPTSGIYFINIKSDKGIVTKKLIIQ